MLFSLRASSEEIPYSARTGRSKKGARLSADSFLPVLWELFS